MAQRETMTMQAVDVELLRLDGLVSHLPGAKVARDVRETVERLTHAWEAHRCELMAATPPAPLGYRPPSTGYRVTHRKQHAEL